ncbi:MULTISPECIES: hypothetical protein [Shewanella]|uniref:hypothetical protein n=1 Tax=Shewanella TaxID=22 RepID=UPI00193E96B5|nr:MULTISPECIES: hypothetical protein [Shewanella]MDL3985672.1 hypothetical protein [Shewanella xiamenensis]QRK78425.1 hypothetical protein JM642_14100 [Shewanella sp. LZH-2]UML92621.1 hypothetical protein MKD32_14390 [Shewanella xiamenensis]
MSVVKTMSIIGMVFFPLCLILASAFAEVDLEASAGWGIFSALYGIGYSITVFVQNKKLTNSAT